MGGCDEDGQSYSMPYRRVGCKGVSKLVNF